MLVQNEMGWHELQKHVCLQMTVLVAESEKKLQREVDQFHSVC